MNLFETVKAGASVQEAAGRYGIKSIMHRKDGFKYKDSKLTTS